MIIVLNFQTKKNTITAHIGILKEQQIKRQPLLEKIDKLQNWLRKNL